MGDTCCWEAWQASRAAAIKMRQELHQGKAGKDLEGQLMNIHEGDGILGV